MDESSADNVSEGPTPSEPPARLQHPQDSEIAVRIAFEASEPPPPPPLTAESYSSTIDIAKVLNLDDENQQHTPPATNDEVDSAKDAETREETKEEVPQKQSGINIVDIAAAHILAEDETVQDQTCNDATEDDKTSTALQIIDDEHTSSSQALEDTLHFSLDSDTASSPVAEDVKDGGSGGGNVKDEETSVDTLTLPVDVEDDNDKGDQTQPLQEIVTISDEKSENEKQKENEQTVEQVVAVVEEDAPKVAPAATDQGDVAIEEQVVVPAVDEEVKREDAALNETLVQDETPIEERLQDLHENSDEGSMLVNAQDMLVQQEEQIGEEHTQESMSFEHENSIVLQEEDVQASIDETHMIVETIGNEVELGEEQQVIQVGENIISLEVDEQNSSLTEEAAVTEEEPEFQEQELDEAAVDDPTPVKSSKMAKIEGKASGAKKIINIPNHVLGRNIDKPLKDPVRNGRNLMKPRLGVKVPYRNLTSQIVSKQEIQEELLERSRQRQSSAEDPLGGDIFFKKRLTQRLANKISPDVVKLEEIARQQQNDQRYTIAASSDDKITDNSELIALLEGDDVIEWDMEKEKVNKKGSIEWEREVALKQLRELPKIGRSQKIFGNGTSKASNMQPPAVEVPQSSSTKNDMDDIRDELINMVPRFSSAAVVKTYTRKRKPSEDIQAVLAASSKKAAISRSSLNDTPSSESNVTPPKKVADDCIQKMKLELEKAAVAVVKSPVGKIEKLKAELKKSNMKESKVNKDSKAATKDTKVSKEVKKESKETKDTKVVAKEVKESKEIVKESKNLKATKELVKETKDNAKVSEEQPKDRKQSIESKTPKETKKASMPKLIPEVPPVPASEPPATGSVSPNTYISKSSRVVKRKKIWDPDEVTTVKSPAFKSPKISSESKPSTPKATSASSTPPVEKQQPLSKVDKKVKSSPAVVEKVSSLSKPIAKKKKSPALAKKEKRRLTEVERLLMDEGAVNLLYSVKNSDELPTSNLAKNINKKGLLSLDRVQRDLLNKTNEIRNDLLLNSSSDSHISLRKKEVQQQQQSTSPSTLSSGTGAAATSTPVSLSPAVHLRKKSRDSTAGSSVHSPPASPAFGSYPSEHHDGASRIIRRHSSSSFSSEASEGEASIATATTTTKSSLKAYAGKKKVAAATAKSQAAKQQAASAVTLIGEVDKKMLNREMSKNFNKLSTNDPKYAGFDSLAIKKYDHLYQIILAPVSDEGQSTFSLQIFKELIKVLKILEEDETCRVVLLCSSGTSFSQGINYKELHAKDLDVRKSLANTYSIAVREFLIALARFSKVIVAGVHGLTIGLGVTMLSLFDMVLASDSAMFATPYARLGCPAEGGNLLTLRHVIHNSLASELFFAARKVTAAECLRQGLVTRTLWPDKFQEELISSLKVIANKSLQGTRALKRQLRHQLLQHVEAALVAETELLVQAWTSDECQENFGTYSVDLK